MGQVDEAVKVRQLKQIDHGLGVVRWLIPKFIDLAVKFANPSLRDRMDLVHGTKSSECLLVFFQQQQVNLCLRVRSAIFRQEWRGLDEITKPLQLNDKCSAHWCSLRIFST